MSVPRLNVWGVYLRTAIGSESLNPHTIRRTKQEARDAYLAFAGDAVGTLRLQRGDVRLGRVIVHGVAP